ncbi:MAG: ACT domain-containing protein [Ruminococcaceae bacterium]|nr:ACT domain-containing protein [Oscillospiraceae bacterium]
MSIKQISVFLENKTGQIAEITALLAENNIDLRAISIAETSDYGVLRIITDDADRSAAILLEAGNIVSMTPVTVVAVEDKPAGLSGLLSIIARSDISIDYMYSLFTKHEGTAYMVFRVSSGGKFANLLKEHGMKGVTAEELGLK